MTASPLAVIVLVLLAPLLSPYDIDSTDWDRISIGPSASTAHWFGTDDVGRDLFVRTLYGGRISLLVGLAATLVSLVIGIAWGATAGYAGGKTDQIMMRIVDVLYAMPFMFFVILLMVFFGRNIFLIFIAVGAINWLDMARIVRGQTLSLRAISSQLIAPMATKISRKFLSNNTINRMTKKINGIAYSVSTIRIMTASVRPPT